MINEIYNTIRKYVLADIEPLSRSLERASLELKTITKTIESITTKQPKKYAKTIRRKSEAQQLLANAYEDYKNVLTRKCQDTFAKAIGSRHFLPSHETEMKLQVTRQLQADFEELVRSTEERVTFKPPVKAKRISNVNPPRTAPSGTMTSLNDNNNSESSEEEHLPDRRTVLLNIKNLQELGIPDFQENEEKLKRWAEDIARKKRKQTNIDFEEGYMENIPECESVNGGIQIKDPNMAHDYDYIIPEENWDGNA